MSGNAAQVPGFCRDCLAEAGPGERCPTCGGPRLVRHGELHELAIAHIDCDAFYAAIEKRDDPSLVNRPVIVGGGRRGVVATACYLARIHGVHSAMPMFKALEACPDAVVIRPNMEKYVAVGREVRAMMRALTPLVEPLSIDEAFLDLSGTELVHRSSPARALQALATRIERELGITISVGLSHNKFLAKIASDLDKPRGFSVIGRAETEAFLAPRPIGTIWGVGKALQRRLTEDGCRRIGDLRGAGERTLTARYGAIGKRLAALAWGRDERRVTPLHDTKSISSETTFDRDVAALEELERRLWQQCERVSARAKAAGLAGATAVLKLKTSRFRTLTRQSRMTPPSQLADTLFRALRPLLTHAADGTRFRLIGAGLADLGAADDRPAGDLFAEETGRQAQVEAAIDAVRARYGAGAVAKGRSLRAAPRRPRKPARSGTPDP